MDIRIDTLRLQASGMEPDKARRFARLVAERLAAALATWPAAPGQGGPGAAGTSPEVPSTAGAGPAAPRPARLSSLCIAVRAPVSGGLESLAAHLAAEVSVALRSAGAPAGSRAASGRSVPGHGPAGRR